MSLRRQNIQFFLTMLCLYLLPALEDSFDVNFIKITGKAQREITFRFVGD